MTEAQAAEPRAGRAYEVRLGTLIWVAAGALFVALRIAGLVSIPVGGVELDSLSGAWQASIGLSDDRYVPTLFQAVTALSLNWADSELEPRLLALLASATIPFAIYRLRDLMSEAGALAALMLLTFDAPGVLLGSTANMAALDAAMALWLIVWLQRRAVSDWHWAVAGFLGATCGPVVLSLLVAIAAIRLIRVDQPAIPPLVYGAAGVVAGALVTSLQFGLGWDGLRIAPIEAFAAGYDSRWSNDTTGALTLLYLGPLLVLTIPSAVWAVATTARERGEMPLLLPLAWTGVAFLWLLSSFGEHNPLPLAAFSLAAATLVGPALARGLSVVLAADWTAARYLVPGAIGALLIALAFMMDWARSGRAGGLDQQVAAWGMVLVAAGCVALIVSQRQMAATAALIAVPFLVFPHLAGVFGVAFGGPNEPMPSPISPVQAREIREIAVTARAEAGGVIAIHPRYEDAITWPFRDSGDVVFATQPPLDAVVLVWPTDAALPDGYSIVEGEWALLRERTGPEGDWLDYLRWYFNRNTLGVGSLPVSVYLKASE